MSNALAISGVTAVVESLLNSVYSSSGLGTVAVSALAPDIIQATLGTSNAPPLQVNIFLHQVTPNAAWRNIGLPSLAADGSTQLSNPPLALDLHYLLTAYAAEDLMAEALLGYGIQLIHEMPVLPRSQIRAALGSILSTNPLSTLLGSSGLADQIEMLKITPATLGREELAWLWTALKADYRPTFPFQVSVVLIQAPAPSVSALPVLQRQITVQPNLVISPTSPILTAAIPPTNQPAACVGDQVAVRGATLSEITAVVLLNSRLGVEDQITSLSAVGNTSFEFTVPDVPVGVYLLTAQATLGVTSNGIPLAIAAKISAGWPPAPGTIASGTNVSVNNIPCTPAIQVGQQASLFVGGQQGLVQSFTAATNSPSFIFASLQPTYTSVPAWLRVDGIDSPIIDMTKSPPVFTGPSVQVI
jgi:Pvc16 N-terminal domain